MTVKLKVPFSEFAKRHRISKDSSQYRRLELLYSQIQDIQEFLAYSTRFRPIGKATEQVFRESFMKVSPQLKITRLSKDVDVCIRRVANLEKALLKALERGVQTLASKASRTRPEPPKRSSRSGVRSRARL